MKILPLGQSKVVAAAVRSNGMIWYGWRHADIMAKMREDGIDRLRIVRAEQGFQTTRQAFVSRASALRTAIGSGQIDHKKPPHVLLSEHLWDANGNPLPASSVSAAYP